MHLFFLCSSLLLPLSLSPSSLPFLLLPSLPPPLPSFLSCVASPSPDAPHRSSLKGGHKKGSMHYMKKKDGKEDTSTFVIQEGMYIHVHCVHVGQARNLHVSVSIASMTRTFPSQLSCLGSSLVVRSWVHIDLVVVVPVIHVLCTRTPCRDDQPA